ncbi:SLC34A1 [Symbiodinium pilosum]|uniref:SLC34A1 protein n=1 Tax=Symbiodinium pilosum TaxID=2952 RepID=A0A812QNQ0_SYMPI|nr:SLC34A1 [Symbiodinium pilosum]
MFSQIILGAITGEGGLLFYISKGIADAAMGGSGGDITFTSPTKFIVSPVTDIFVDPNKDVTKALSLGPPKATAMPAGVTGCPANMDCTNYFCVSSSMSKNWKKAHKNQRAEWA